MKPEDKELLLKDLCARLPYGVICRFTDTFDGCEVDNVLHPDDITDMFRHRSHWDSRIDVKPYLRPISSMTEEERDFLKKMGLETVHKCIEEEDPRKILSLNFKQDAEELAYLYKHHYDVFGFIPMGAAIEVTEKNNPYKDKD